MFSISDLLMFFAMVFLRVGVPLLVTAGIVYAFKRLDRRWEAEARAQREAEAPSEQPAAPVGPRPATPARPPAQPAVPMIIPPMPVREQRAGLGYGHTGLVASAGQPCWDAKSCGTDAKARCAAPSHPDQACWQARFQAEGAIPEECVSCDIFQRYPAM
jgi:hypothetical protein